ncbi:MAG TPA: 50S ribosomal protein L29 [Candidatus Portnoybacteria bacterium]|nr:50S ribosomal protein L29 [Candidatus Portnoybacteria bacterium]
MKAKELIIKEDPELKRILQETKARLVQLRFEWKTKKLKNVNQVKETKKDIARILTILKEKSKP